MYCGKYCKFQIVITLTHFVYEKNFLIRCRKSKKKGVSNDKPDVEKPDGPEIPEIEPFVHETKV